jgi:Ser/Thr protein kinase RdoA (MazF antagonist)
MATEPNASFFALTPDRVLDAVEVGGLRSTGRCLPLRAFENRVYEVELEDERRLIVKFYRPGRWSRETILDEHQFLADLAEAEVPAVAPLDLGHGSTLSEIEGIYYAAFPKVRGRSLDELDAENRRHIGRTLGRLHAVGAARPAPIAPAGRAALHPRAAQDLDGRRLHPGDAGAALSRHCPADRRRRRQAARRRPHAAHPRRPALGQHPVDARRADPGRLRRQRDGATGAGSLAAGPGPGRGGEEGARGLLEGYELFREFDRSTLALVEPLRAMRIIYMSGWIAKRWEDPSFPHAYPNFKDVRYWMQEYEALVEIAELLA